MNQRSRTKKEREEGKIGESSEYRATQQKIACVEQIYSEFLFDEVVKKQKGFRQEKEDEKRRIKEAKEKEIRDKNEKRIEEHKNNLVKSIEEKKEYEDKLIEMTRSCNLNYLHYEEFKNRMNEEDKENFDDLLKYDTDLANSFSELEANIHVIEKEQDDKVRELAQIKVEIQRLKYFKKSKYEEE